MSIKIKHAITEALIKVEGKTFDEDTVRTLLIVSREYLNYDGLVKELAHFIAHPKRDRGIFHKKVNSRYTKLKLVERQLSKSQPEIKTEEELSNFMLGGVELEKIDAKLFKTLYIDGLDDLPESHILKYTRLTKTEAEKALKDHYTKKGSFYYLNTMKTKEMISLLQQLPNIEDDTEIQKTIKEGQILANKIESLMDSLQKVIRGVIYFDSVFDTNSLIEDLTINYEKILSDFSINPKYTKVISDNIQDFLLCLMSLIHDSTIEFDDKNTARVYMCIYLSHDDVIQESISRKETLYESGVLALYSTYQAVKGHTSFPLFVSDLKLKDYVDRDDFMQKDIAHPLIEIPWLKTKRIGSKLKLIEYS